MNGPDGVVWEPIDLPPNLFVCPQKPYPIGDPPSYPPYVKPQQNRCPASPGRYELSNGVCVLQSRFILLLTPDLTQCPGYRPEASQAQWTFNPNVGKWSPEDTKPNLQNIEDTINGSIINTLNGVLGKLSLEPIPPINIVPTVKLSRGKPKNKLPSFSSQLDTVSKRIIDIENALPENPQGGSMKKSK